MSEVQTLQLSKMYFPITSQVNYMEKNLNDMLLI